MAARSTLSPPPTLNHIPALQRARLLRSTRKLGAVLGAQPVLLEVADPYEVRPSCERADLNELLPLGPTHSRSKSLVPSPVPSPTKSSLAPAAQRPVRQGRSSKRDNFLNLGPSKSLREPRSFSASGSNRKKRTHAPEPLILSVQPVEVDPSDPRLLDGRSSKSPLQPSSAANSPSPPRRVNTPRKFSRASSTSSLVAPSSPSSSINRTPLTPSFRFRAPEIPAERRRKMARLGRMLGENVPPELVFKQHKNHLESFWDDSSAEAEKPSMEGRDSAEWLLLGNKYAEEDMGIPPSASPPRRPAQSRARSASPNLPSTTPSPFDVVFPLTDFTAPFIGLDSRRPSEAEVALASIPAAIPSTPRSSKTSLRASHPDVPMDVEQDVFSMPTSPTVPADTANSTTTIVPSPPPVPLPGNRTARHKRRSASLGSLARPLQLHLQLGTGGGAWKPPAEWAVGPSPPASPTPVTRFRAPAQHQHQHQRADTYIPRAASLDSVMPIMSPRAPTRKVWAEVTTGLDLLSPEQAARVIAKDRAERKEEKARLGWGYMCYEVIDQLRNLRR